MLLMIHFFSSKVVALPRFEFHDRHDDLLKLYLDKMNQYNAIISKIITHYEKYEYVGQAFSSISLK